MPYDILHSSSVIIKNSFYEKALMDHESIANDLTHPKTSGYDYVVLAIFGSGWQLLTEAEKIYQEVSAPMMQQAAIPYCYTERHRRSKQI
ncbi:hypothetical protein RJ035_007539 [Blastomyces gilchristii]